MRGIFVVLSGLVMVAGCASLQLQTRVRLLPPTDAAGLACVNQCDGQLKQCQSACKQRQQACTQTLDPQIEARHAEALKQYAADLQRYAMALRHAELQMRLEWLHRHPFRHPHADLWWEPWPRYGFPYAEPIPPSREAIRAELEQSACPSDCGCLPAFDTCFTGCGGKRITETVCVANCPATK